jgi:dihydrofolate reductase
MNVSLVWAQSTSGVLGRAGGIPWDVPEDLTHFKNLTMSHTVLMGRRTWESLPHSVRPLPGRRNVVLTRQKDFTAQGATVVHAFDEALTAPDTWVVGGRRSTSPGSESRGTGGSADPACATACTATDGCDAGLRVRGITVT